MSAFWFVKPTEDEAVANLKLEEAWVHSVSAVRIPGRAQLPLETWTPVLVMVQCRDIEAGEELRVLYVDLGAKPVVPVRPRAGA